MERVGIRMYMGEDISNTICSLDFSGNKEKNSTYGL